MSKRINIVLPTAIIQTIDRLAKPGMRSRFIKTAVDHYVANRSTEALILLVLLMYTAVLYRPRTIH